MFDSFQDIVASWPSRKALAEAMGTVTPQQTQKWYERDYIPDVNWRRLAEVMCKTDRARADFVYHLAYLASLRLAA